MSDGMEARLARIEARGAVENLMGSYVFLLAAGRYDDICGLFAQRDDTRAEMNWGVYDGYEGIVRCYAHYHKDNITGPGVLAVHALSTPVIEVAGDLATARAVWISPGHITGGMFSADGVIRAHWAWMRYGCDFLRDEDSGAWKIWHLHVYGLFMTPVEKSWVDVGDAHEMPVFPPEYAPDRPPTRPWAYAPDREPPDFPAPPKPYESFDPADAF